LNLKNWLRRRQKIAESKLVNFNCPLKLLAEFDEAIKSRYSGRTDALLDAMRDLIEKLGGA
jgi:metal-responsive CopG/Arc/MetJ family transcriptional regulator